MAVNHTALLFCPPTPSLLASTTASLLAPCTALYTHKPPSRFGDAFSTQPCPVLTHPRACSGLYPPGRPFRPLIRISSHVGERESAGTLARMLWNTKERAGGKQRVCGQAAGEGAAGTERAGTQTGRDTRGPAAAPVQGMSETRLSTVPQGLGSRERSVSAAACQRRMPVHALHQHTTAPGTTAATGGPQGQSLPAAQSKPPLLRCAGWRLRREEGGRPYTVEWHMAGAPIKQEQSALSPPSAACAGKAPKASQQQRCGVQGQPAVPLRTRELGAGPVPSSDHPVQHHLKHARQPASVGWNKRKRAARVNSCVLVWVGSLMQPGTQRTLATAQPL